MKKLLSLLGSFALIATASTAAVACTNLKVSANIQKILDAINPVLNQRYSDPKSAASLIVEAQQAAKAAYEDIVFSETDSNIKVNTIYLEILELSYSNSMIEFKVTIKECVFAIESTYYWSEHFSRITTLFGEEARKFVIRNDKNVVIDSLEVQAFESERIYISANDNQLLPTNIEIKSSNDSKLVARWEKSNNTSSYVIAGLAESQSEFISIAAAGFETLNINVAITKPKDPYENLSAQDLKDLYVKTDQAWISTTDTKWEEDVRALFDKNKVKYEVIDGTLTHVDEEGEQLYQWFSQNSETVYQSYKLYIDLSELAYRYYLLTGQEIDEHFAWELTSYEKFEKIIIEYVSLLPTYPKGLTEYRDNVLKRTKDLVKIY